MAIVINWSICTSTAVANQFDQDRAAEKLLLLLLLLLVDKVKERESKKGTLSGKNTSASKYVMCCL